MLEEGKAEMLRVGAVMHDIANLVARHELRSSGYCLCREKVDAFDHAAHLAAKLYEGNEALFTDLAVYAEVRAAIERRREKLGAD